ncbi:MAG: hypothetical protein ABW036_02200 [Flavitalea sp.]
MELKVLCTRWGSANLSMEEFIEKVLEAGYDGIDTWLPESYNDRELLMKLTEQHKLLVVIQQHQAAGNTIDSFCDDFRTHLNEAGSYSPYLINSHSGRDFFSLEDQQRVLDVADEFSASRGIPVSHETHRGRIGYAPWNAIQHFTTRKDMKVTADISHWVCVTESLLEEFREALDSLVKRTAHIHARVGFAQGPQIPDPTAPHWKTEVDFHVAFWKRIFAYRIKKKLADSKGIEKEFITITPEFGPAPYMWINPSDGKPVADQWTSNLKMMKLVRKAFNELQPALINQ